jgi:hypothetical protein
MLRALEQIRRMRGGAQSHLMRCDDGYYYVVKFQNNPQHTRVLVDELLGTRLATRLGRPTVSVDIVAVSEELIRLTPDLAMDVALQRAPSRAGAPGSRAQMRLYCSQVFRQARLWERVEKSVRASEFTFPGDPMRLDYSYRRNGTRGFVQCLSVTRAPDLRCGWPS